MLYFFNTKCNRRELSVHCTRLLVIITDTSQNLRVQFALPSDQKLLTKPILLGNRRPEYRSQLLRVPRKNQLTCGLQKVRYRNYGLWLYGVSRFINKDVREVIARETGRHQPAKCREFENQRMGLKSPLYFASFTIMRSSYK